jgi:hypothetical protein
MSSTTSRSIPSLLEQPSTSDSADRLPDPTTGTLVAPAPADNPDAHGAPPLRELLPPRLPAELIADAATISNARRTDADGPPPICGWDLAGPRPESEGRGATTSTVTAIRNIIRCPLLHQLAALFPPKTTGRPTPPAQYFLFYSQLAREAPSHQAVEHDLLEYWNSVIRPEFAAFGINLPPAQPGMPNPVPGYSAYKRWRRQHLTEAGKLFVALGVTATPTAPCWSDAP